MCIIIYCSWEAKLKLMSDNGYCKFHSDLLFFTYLLIFKNHLVQYFLLFSNSKYAIGVARGILITEMLINQVIVYFMYPILLLILENVCFSEYVMFSMKFALQH